MITYTENKKIDRQKWDDCIKRCSNSSIYAYSWYLDVVCEGWSAIILNDYEAVSPIASRSKYNINYIYQPFFSRYFGVFAEYKISQELVSGFMDAIPGKFKFLEFCLNEDNLLDSKLYDLKEKKFQVLDLDRSYNAIQKEFSDNAKRNVKKAIKSGLEIRKGISSEKIVNLFKVTKGDELKVFGRSDYKTLIMLMNKCNELERGHSISVYSRGKLCAAAFFMFSEGRFTFLKSGVTEEGKAHGAMHFLFDYFIKVNSEKNYLLDFGGSSVESVARFYKNFGAKDCVYLQLKKNNLPKFVRWVKSLKS